ncbi:RAB6A, partial [Symbiodinium pilosum]
AMSRIKRRIHVSLLLLLLSEVVAIHDGAHGPRTEASSDEIMRRDGPRVSRHQPSESSLDEALVQGDGVAEQPYGPLGFGSLGYPSYGGFGSGGYSPPVSSAPKSPYMSSFSNVLGTPKVVSAAAKEDSKESKDKKDIDFNNIDYIGCIIPQWTDGDWICAEAADVPDLQIYDDAQHRTRKKLREGDVCTVQCPDPRYWQSAQPSSLVCKSGRWRDQVSRVNVKKIECETAARWFFLVGFLTFGLPLCCCCGAAGVVLRMKRKKKDPPPSEPAEEKAEPAAEGAQGAASAPAEGAPAEATGTATS